MLVLAAGVALAHPMGTMSTNRSAILDLRGDEAVLRYTVEFAEVPSAHEVPRITALGADYPGRRMAELLPSLSLTADAAAVDLRIHRCFQSTVPGDGGLPTVTLACDLRAPLPSGDIVLSDDNFAGTPGWREAVVVRDGPVPLPFSSADLRRDTATASLAASIPSFGVVALVSAFLLGAAHALAPGHGKSLVAAYLVGSRGTVRHAVLLGLLVTLTHVGVVLGLATLALSFAEIVVTEAVYPWIGVSSGAGVVALGAVLMRNRWVALSAPGVHAHAHEAGGSLLAVGVSGGLVPCPSALVVLMSAIALHRLVLGLALVGAFSAGLAAVLVGVGVLAVRSGPWVDRLSAPRSAARWLPIASAAVVIVLGVGIAVQSAYEGGLLRP